MPVPRVPVDGRLVDEPAVKFSESGMPLCRLRVACSDKRKDPETGKWEDTQTAFITIKVFGPLAEHCGESLAKGDLVLAYGRLVTEEWTDQSGNNRQALVLLADAVGPSLQFRTLPHGGGKAKAETEVPGGDPWAEAPRMPNAPDGGNLGTPGF